VGFGGQAIDGFQATFLYDPGYVAAEPWPVVYATLTCELPGTLNYTFNPTVDTITITVIEGDDPSHPLHFVGGLEGSTSGGAGPVYLDFDDPSQMLGATTYMIEASQQIDVSFGKPTDIRGDVVPEPSNFGILAVALFALGFFRLRKSRTLAANQVVL